MPPVIYFLKIKFPRPDEPKVSRRGAFFLAFCFFANHYIITQECIMYGSSHCHLYRTLYDAIELLCRYLVSLCRTRVHKVFFCVAHYAEIGSSVRIDLGEVRLSSDKKIHAAENESEWHCGALVWAMTGIRRENKERCIRSRIINSQMIVITWSFESMNG